MEKYRDNNRAPVRLRFRPVRWQRDLTAMMAIEQAGFARPWSWEKFFHFSGRDDTQAVIAEQDGVIVGFLLCECYDDRVHVAHVAVHPEYQNGGIGSSLIGSACADDLPVTLNVRVSNVRAQNLYARMGFAVCELKQAHYDDGEDAYVMRYEDRAPASRSRSRARELVLHNQI